MTGQAEHWVVSNDRAVTTATCDRELVVDVMGDCSGNFDEVGASALETPEPVSGELLHYVGEAVQSFAFELYQTLPDAENVVFSPYAIFNALALLHAGASGEAAAEVQAMLGLELPGEDLHGALHCTREELLSLRGLGAEPAECFRFDSFNQLWGQRGVQWEQDFLGMLATFHDAGVKQLDLRGAPQQAADVFARWLEARTGHVAGTRSASTTGTACGPAVDNGSLAVSNAALFEARWAHPFDAHWSTEGAFHTLDGTTVQVPFLRHGRDQRLAYTSAQNYEAVVLPYSDAPIDFIVVLPEQGALSDVESALSEEMLEEALMVEPRPVRLNLPRFEFSALIDLRDCLSRLGVHELFSAEADFSLMASESLALSAVQHQARVRVDELGTTRAVAPGPVALGVCPAEEAICLSVDRPFLFFIHHRTTSQLLFMGRVVNPALGG